MIIFGTRSKVEQLGSIGLRHCPACGQDRDAWPSVHYSYFHLWYIFRFVTSKRFAITCGSCGRGEWVPASEVEPKLPAPPIPAWTRYSWMAFVGLILCAVAGVATSEWREGKDTESYLAAPVAKDLYVVDISKLLKHPPTSPMYSLLEVEQVGPQAIAFKAARMYYTQARGAEEDASSPKVQAEGYFRPEVLELDRARISAMRAEGTLRSIHRR